MREKKPCILIFFNEIKNLISHSSLITLWDFLENLIVGYEKKKSGRWIILKDASHMQCEYIIQVTSQGHLFPIVMMALIWFSPLYNSRTEDEIFLFSINNIYSS